MQNQASFRNHQSDRRCPHPSRKKTSNRGFSLIELAVVLCITSMMLITTLHGKELYAASQVKTMANELRALSVAMYMFQEKYKALPGDDASASNHFNAPLTSNGNGNMRIDGNWFDTGATSEASKAWLHLRLAGLEKGSTSINDPGYMPTNFSGGFIGLQSGSSNISQSPIIDVAGSPIAGNYIACSRGIIGKTALELDTLMDDGNPGTGKIMATPDSSSYALGAPAATLRTGGPTDLNPASTYIVCAAV